MNPLKQSVYKKLKGTGLQDLADKVNEIARRFSPDSSMGVSAWKNLGIKYGYWNHFKQEVKKDIIEELLK